MRNNSKTFSIITVNFNSGGKLACTAASVFAQTSWFEYLIIDGSSTDSSLVFVRNLAVREPARIKLISEVDRGIYDAMNKGVRAASGRYILFLGAGDVLFPEVLVNVEKLLPCHERGFIYGDVKWGAKSYDGEFTWRDLIERNICHQAIFYGRDVFRICGEYDLKYARLADWEFNLRCFGERDVVKKYIPVVVSEFEPGGISALGDEALRRDWKGLQRLHLGYLRMVELFCHSVVRYVRRGIKACCELLP